MSEGALGFCSEHLTSDRWVVKHARINANSRKHENGMA